MLFSLFIDKIKCLLGQDHIVARVRVVVLEHDLDDVVDLDVDAVVDYRLKQLQRVSVVLVGILFLLIELVGVVVEVLGCGEQLDCLLHLELLKQSEQEKCQLDLALHENIVLLSILCTNINQILSHHVCLVLQHVLRLILEVTLCRNSV